METMEKKIKEYKYRNNYYLKPHGLRIVNSKGYFLIKFFALIGFIVIILTTTAVITSAMFNEPIIVDKFTITIEHKISEETINTVKEYINQTILKGG